jgi:carbon starvation protein
MFFVVFNTSFGALQKIFHSDPNIGFLAHASYLKEALLKGQLPANIPSPDVAQRIIFGDYLNVFVLSLYLVIVSFVFITAISRWGKVISERKNNNKSV